MNETSVNTKKKKKRLGRVLFILLNVAVIAVTAYIEFGTDRTVSRQDLMDINPWYLFLVLGCFVMCIVSESLKYSVLIQHTTGLWSVKEGYEVAVLGKYYDFITPLSAGGQPFQAVYLNRRGIEMGAATAIPIAGYLSRHAAFILIALVVLIFGGSVISSQALLIPAIFGLLCVILVPSAIIFFGIAPSVTEKVIRWGVRLLAKLKLVKDPEAREASIIRALHSYISSISSIFTGKTLFLKIFVCSLIFELAMDSMPYFVLRAFGNSLSYISVFRSCVFIYLCIAFIPTPGNSGAAEGSFYALFAVLGQGHLFWAMLVWRFFSYYAFLLIGLISISRNSGKKRLKLDIFRPEA